MKTTVTLGPARMGEAARIAGMSRALIEPGLPWSWTPRRVAAHMRQRDNMVVTARTEKDLVGFAMAHFGDDSVHVTLLAVAESAQRRGIGRQLLAWIEESAETAGVFTVELELRAGNTGARRFYTALGYRETSRVTRYYSGIEDAIRMTRSLQVRN
jgi:ribosomal protein S18 acetylase RimI-like enzyme